MRDITTIDFKRPYGKVASLDIANQKVFYTQDGMEYGNDGKILDAKQAKDYYAKEAAKAQSLADEAAAAATAAQQAADGLLKDAGITKAAVKKAARATAG